MSFIFINFLKNSQICLHCIVLRRKSILISWIFLVQIMCQIIDVLRMTFSSCNHDQFNFMWVFCSENVPMCFRCHYKNWRDRFVVGGEFVFSIDRIFQHMNDGRDQKNQLDNFQRESLHMKFFVLVRFTTNVKINKCYAREMKEKIICAK